MNQVIKDWIDVMNETEPSSDPKIGMVTKRALSVFINESKDELHPDTNEIISLLTDRAKSCAIISAMFTGIKMLQSQYEDQH